MVDSRIRPWVGLASAGRAGPDRTRPRPASTGNAGHGRSFPRPSESARLPAGLRWCGLGARFALDHPPAESDASLVQGISIYRWPFPASNTMQIRARYPHVIVVRGVFLLFAAQPGPHLCRPGFLPLIPRLTGTGPAWEILFMPPSLPWRPEGDPLGRSLGGHRSALGGSVSGRAATRVKPART